MAPATSRTIANVLLAIAVAILVINILGMAGVMHKVAGARELTWLALILLILARILRRTAKRVRPVPSA